MAFNVGSIHERFWQKVLRLSNDRCWEWQANRNNKGYGLIHWGKYGRKVLAHRVSYELHIASIADGQCVLHKCDNPRCVNPDHLFLGSLRDNTQDMIRKGRKRVGINPNNKPPHKFGSQHGGSKLTEDKVLEMRRLLAEGKSLRFCASLFGVDRKNVIDIKYRRIWTHI